LQVKQALKVKKMQSKYQKIDSLSHISDKTWMKIIFKLEALAAIEFKHQKKSG
jgi:hypothetical protein